MVAEFMLLCMVWDLLSLISVSFGLRAGFPEGRPLWILATVTSLAVDLAWSAGLAGWDGERGHGRTAGVLQRDACTGPQGALDLLRVLAEIDVGAAVGA